MRILLCTLLVSCVVALPSVGKAGVLSNFLVTADPNTLEDGSREVFVDLVNVPAMGSGDPVSIDEGDVLIGFSKITSIEPFDSQPGPDITPNSVYAIFSQQFSFIGPDFNPGSGLSRPFEFEPTTTFGLTLSDLLGPLDPGGISDGMIAIVSASAGAFSVDLTNTSPGDRDLDLDVDFADYLDVLHDEGMLDLVFGFDDLGDRFDGLTDATNVSDSEDFIADLSLAPTSGNLVSFSAELSKLHDALPLNIIVGDSAEVVGGTARLPNPGENPDGIFAFVNDADIQFSAQVIVPEPGSTLVWVGLGVCALIFTIRRRYLS